MFPVRVATKLLVYEADQVGDHAPVLIGLGFADLVQGGGKGTEAVNHPLPLSTSSDLVFLAVVFRTYPFLLVFFVAVLCLLLFSIGIH